MVELTLTTAGAATGISRLRDALGDQVVVGVGTVLHPEQVTDTVAAGAQFVVTPAVRPAVAARCVELGVQFVCGAFTPSEVAAALDLGTQLIKIFPASLGGPGHLKDLAGPFPEARFIPTGGVSAQNAMSYFTGGAVAVGMGTSLVQAETVNKRDWRAIEAAARGAMAAI